MLKDDENRGGAILWPFIMIGFIAIGFGLIGVAIGMVIEQ